MMPKLSDTRLDEVLMQCRAASHNGKTLGQNVTLPASHVEALVREVKELRSKKR